MPNHTYSEKEVAQIIKRAAELESEQSDLNELFESRPGLSLDELSRIAVEAGLDPENVRIAAKELEPSTSEGTSTIHKDEVVYEQWVHGTFTDELADLVIADLNHRYNATHEKGSWMDDILYESSMEPDQKSRVQRTGKSLEWKKVDEYGMAEVRVLIQPRRDQVRIRVSKKNVWGTSIRDMDGDLYEYLSYIPYLGGLAVFLFFSYGFFINAILGILGFAALQFTILPVAKFFRDKWSDKMSQPGSKSKPDQYRNEVEQIANDLANLLGDTTPDTLPGEQINIPEDPQSEDSNPSQTNKNRNRQR